MKSQISKLIPKGKGYNIATYYKNGGKTKGLFARYAKQDMQSRQWRRESRQLWFSANVALD